MQSGFSDNNFSVLDVYLNEKGPSAKIKLLNLFKAHHIVAYSGSTAVGYNRSTLPNVLWMKY